MKRRTIKLNYDVAKILAVQTAITALDGGGFELGALRLCLAQNINALEPFIQGYSQARDVMIRANLWVAGVLEFPEMKPGHPNWPKYLEQHESIYRQKCDVTLLMFNESELNVSENEIPSLVLAPLMDLMIEDEPEGQVVTFSGRPYTPKPGETFQSIARENSDAIENGSSPDRPWEFSTRIP